MRLLLFWLLALVCLSQAQDEEATTPLTTPAAGETSPQETVAEESESVTTEEVVVTTEDAADVTESLSEETTEEEVDVADGGEVVIEADEEEEEDGEVEEEEATVVKSAQYTMSTDAALGLEIEIVLEHLSNDKVRMVCEMEEKEDTSEESDSATETTLAPAAEDNDAAEASGFEDSEAESEGSGALEEVAEAGSGGGSKAITGDSISGGTIYLIADRVACADIAAAVTEGSTVEALPLADITGVGDAIGFLDVAWSDIARGSCLAILKEDPQATTVAPEEEETTLSLPRRRKMRMFSGGNVLRTEGLPRVFTAINLATFSVLSVGVTGVTDSRLFQLRQLQNVVFRCFCGGRRCLSSLVLLIFLIIFFQWQLNHSVERQRAADLHQYRGARPFRTCLFLLAQRPLSSKGGRSHTE